MPTMGLLRAVATLGTEEAGVAKGEMAPSVATSQ